MSDTPWIKWYPADFLNGVADLSPHEIAVYTIILCRIYDEDRAIPHDVQKIARRCNMRVPQCEKVLKSLIDEGKLFSDDNVIDNKRAQKEREKRQETSSKQSRNSTKRWQEEAKKANKNNDSGIPRESQTDAKPMPTRSQKPEPDKEEESYVQQAFDLWNKMADDLSLAKAQKLSKSRKAKLKARLKDAGGIEGWKVSLEKVKASRFLQGQTGDGSWKADLDFVLRESKFIKLMEGSYDNRDSNNAGKTANHSGGGSEPASVTAAVNSLLNTDEIEPVRH